MANAILPEAATAHVEELSDPYLIWFWNSNVRSTAIVLNSLVKANAPDAQYRGDGALADRRRARTDAGATPRRTRSRWSRWSRTTAASSRRCRTSPRWRSSATRKLASAQFQGRSTEAKATDMPMAKLLVSAPAGSGAAADLHAHRRRHALLLGAPALRRRSTLPDRDRIKGSASPAPTRPTSRTARGRPRPASRPAISCASR